MKTKILSIIPFLAVALTQPSCVDDNSNYDYKHLNEVAISGIEPTYTALMLDQLTITPVITRDLRATEDDLEFLWTIYDPIKTYNTPDTLAKTRDLDVQVNVMPGTYTVSYRVKDTGSGVSYRSEFKVTVTSELQRGYLVLSEVDANANVAFIGITGKVYEDIYRNMNGEEAGQNPVSILYTYRAPLDYVAIVCNDARGGVCLSSTSFKRLFDFKELFYEAPAVYNPQMLAIIEGYGSVSDYQVFGNQMYFMNGGRLHVRDVNYNVTVDGSLVTVEAKFYNEFPGDYDIAPLHFQEVLFDRKYKRFMYIPSFAAPNLFVTAAKPTGVFDPANVGLKIVWGKRTLGSRGLFYCNSVFKNTAGDYFYLKFDATNKAAINPLKKVAIPAGYKIRTASVFTGNLLEDYIYFAAGSKVYVYDCILNQEREIFDFATLGAGYTVDDIRWHEAVLTARIMHVCVSNGQTGKCGSVYEMSVAQDGKLTVKNAYPNICGRVVSTHWKN